MAGYKLTPRNTPVMVILKTITPACAASFKLVRLRALLDTPLAFGSTYAKESQITDAEWEARAAQWNGDRSTGYLAWDGENPCGIVACFLDATDPRIARLISMWVAPTHRRLGVGQLLVGQVIDWALTLDVQTVSLLVTSINESAIRFYERLGFTKTGRTEPYPNDDSLIELEMVRSVC
jgi:ribosomal protein S18 acetylase RimI-like enzyme